MYQPCCQLCVVAVPLSHIIYLIGGAEVAPFSGAHVYLVANPGYDTGSSYVFLRLTLLLLHRRMGRPPTRPV